MEQILHLKKIYILVMVLVMCSCSDRMQKLSSSGAEPPLTHIQDPRSLPNYRPIVQPVPMVKTMEAYPNNSLWRNGATSFFKDLRAQRVGDIVTVKIDIQNETGEMTFDNKGERGDGDGLLVNGLLNPIAGAFGVVGKAAANLLRKASGVGAEDGTPQAQELKKGDVRSAFQAKGKTTRNTKMTLTVPATIIQVLPSGNLVFNGYQEVRLNNEIRVVNIQGIVRKSDISSENIVTNEHIAQLRLSVGGRGAQNNLLRKPYLYSFLDKLDPLIGS